MRRGASLNHLHRSFRLRLPRARDSDENPRGRAERACDRIRVARRSEISQGGPRSRLRADALAQRIHRATPRPAEGIVALTAVVLIRDASSTRPQPAIVHALKSMSALARVITLDNKREKSYL